MSERKELFTRTELLLGEEAMAKLWRSRVAIFGIGGVGGHAAEALVRSGIGEVDVIDNDVVALSNLNRQLIATHSSVGRKKTAVMRERLLDINPELTVHAWDCFFVPEKQNLFPFSEYDYIIDAVDTVAAKIGLVMAAREAGVPIISSMGAGNKLNPTMFEVADIYDTTVCPLAKAMRRELKKRGVERLKCVYSKEQPLPGRAMTEEELAASPSARRSTPGSVAFVPSVVGLILASEVIKDLSGIQNG